MVANQLRRAKGRLLAAFFCTLVVSAMELLKPWPLKIILDNVVLNRKLPRLLQFISPVLGGDKYLVLTGLACSIVLISLFSGAFSYSQVFLTSSVGYQLVYAVRRELFTHLQRLSLSFHNRARSGDLLTKIGGDTYILREVFTGSVMNFALDVLTVVGMFVVMFAVSWKITFVALATFPFLCFILFHLYRKTKASVKTQRKQEGRVAARMNEVLSAMPMVQAFAREKYEEEQFDQVTNETLRESIHIARLQAAATRSTQIITAFGTGGTLLFGAVQVLQGRLPPGALILFSSYLLNMYKPIRNLAKLSTDFSKAMASADRLSEILEIEPDAEDGPDAIEASDLRGEIVFDNVSFDYGDGKGALKDVSFTVLPGQRVALVGASGAGKSTVASLILRLYHPQQGTISIDGVNIEQYRSDSLRRQIGIVLQQSLLFGATITENIAYGKPEASEEEIVAAARAANADEFIRELEDGYDAVIGERGATLSGGQRQRIAIARALIRNSPILILDEPMTGLDAESEAKVREALDRLMAGKTSLMITHDLQSIADADLVLVIEAGRIVERGTYSDLMATSSRFRQLYEMSAGQQAQAAVMPVVHHKVATPRLSNYPQDPDFPQLEIAADPERMLDVFRKHLKPVASGPWRIRKCVPFCFRFPQGSSRCVLQYTLHLIEPATGHDAGSTQSQWATAFLYPGDGQAKRLYQAVLDKDPCSKVPKPWLIFEPVCFVPELQMLVTLFPFDRKLPALPRLMDGPPPDLAQLLLARFGPGNWSVVRWDVEAVRYRAELGAVLRYTGMARELRTGATAVRCFYLKVQREQRSHQTGQLLSTLPATAGQNSFSVMRPVAYLAALRTLVLEEAPGISLRDVFLQGGDTVTASARAARALAAFNQSDFAAAQPYSLEEQRMRVNRSAQLIGWACPRLRTAAERVAAAVVTGLEEVPPAPVHRDLKPDHIFLEHDRVTLADLDYLSSADPMIDPARLMSCIITRVGLDSVPLEQARAAVRAFADEYCAHVPVGWHRRLPIHYAAALIEAAAGIFRRQEPQWAEKIGGAVEEAQSALSGGLK